MASRAHRRLVAGGKDEVADPEQLVVGGVPVVEEVLRTAHQRRRPQRVSDLVDVAALQVLETGTAPTVKSWPQFDGIPAYVRPPPSRSINEAIDVGALGDVRAALGRDRGAVPAVVGAELKPRGHEHRDRRNEHGHQGQAGWPGRTWRSPPRPGRTSRR